MLKKDDQIGVYTLVEKVGAGAFGDVWKAERKTNLDSNFFALKFFRPKDNQLNLENIAKELDVWKRLKGLPHIISVIELDKFEEYVYVVSDFADGGSLEKYLAENGNKPLHESEAIKITMDILTGLESLHDKNIIHRDLKPDNILILNGKYCLADFGVSREVKSHSKATGTAGTMEYMPPEAFGNKFSPQTDIWAVGVILQRMLSGQLPFPQDNQAALVGAIIQFEPEKMPDLISADLRWIVEKCLQKNPDERFRSAAEMKSELQDFLKKPPVQASQTEPAVIEPDRTEVLNTAKPADYWDSSKPDLQPIHNVEIEPPPSQFSQNQSQSPFTQPFVDFNHPPQPQESVSSNYAKEPVGDSYSNPDVPPPIADPPYNEPPRNKLMMLIPLTVLGGIILSIVVGGIFYFIMQGDRPPTVLAENKTNNNSVNSTPVVKSESNSESNGNLAILNISTPPPVNEAKETPTPPPSNVLLKPTASPTPTPTPTRSPKPNQNSANSVEVTDAPGCFLDDGGKGEGEVRVRQNCDSKDCENDDSTIAGAYPNKTRVQRLGGSVRTTSYTWTKVKIGGRTVWVAVSKIRCN